MMNIHSFDWRDLPVLHRYRNCGMFLDTALVLTRGAVLAPTRVLFSATGMDTGVYTYLCENDALPKQPLLLQANHQPGSTFARLSFVAPEQAIASVDLAVLFDYLAQAMGEHGAFHILAEVDERSQAFEALRRASFAVYGIQRIWKLESKNTERLETSAWHRCNSQEMVRVRSLYNDLVPGLVQQVEPLPKDHLKGMVYYQDGIVKAYVELRYGPQGIWMQPFIHPDVHDFDGPFVELLNSLPKRRGRSVYICVRSYQSWLEGMLEAAGAAPDSSQAVMVRHLSVVRRATQAVSIPAINGTRAEPITHIVLNPDEQEH
jgi:hypothetical protein